VDQLALGAEQDKPAGSVSVADGSLEIFVALGGLVDLDAEAKRLKKELAKAEKDLASVERTLGNEGFVAKAAPEVIEKKLRWRPAWFPVRHDCPPGDITCRSFSPFRRS
jgi:valyl-tRNA synthetase